MTGRDLTRLCLDAIATAAMVVAAAGIIWTASGRSTAATSVPAVTLPTWEDVSVQNLETSFTLARPGEQRPAVVMIEYSDFQCPYCAEFAERTYPEVKKAYVDSGRIAYDFRHLPLTAIHARAFRAGEAAECAAAQGLLPQMRSRLFASPAALADDDLVGYAKSLTLDTSRFSRCMTGEVANAVQADQTEAARLGLDSTPAFLLGYPTEAGTVKVMRRMVGAVTFPVIKTGIDALLKN